LSWVLSKHTYPTIIAEQNSAAVWNKAKAVMPVIEKSKADIIVMSDADVWTDGLDEAVEAVREGVPWAIPHTRLYRLAESGTQDFLGGDSHKEVELDRRPYRGMRGGGVIVLSRELFLSVPLDPRFEGWGQEDESHGIALSCLTRQAWRGTTDLIHLWHPPQERISRRRGSVQGWKLFLRYRSAKHDTQQMRKLLGEINERDKFNKPPMHSDSADGIIAA